MLTFRIVNAIFATLVFIILTVDKENQISNWFDRHENLQLIGAILLLIEIIAIPFLISDLTSGHILADFIWQISRLAIAVTFFILGIRAKIVPHSESHLYYKNHPIKRNLLMFITFIGFGIVFQSILHI